VPSLPPGCGPPVLLPPSASSESGFTVTASQPRHPLRLCPVFSLPRLSLASPRCPRRIVHENPISPSGPGPSDPLSHSLNQKPPIMGSGLVSSVLRRQHHLAQFRFSLTLNSGSELHSGLRLYPHSAQAQALIQRTWPLYYSVSPMGASSGRSESLRPEP